jgi:hypothetical protein
MVLAGQGHRYPQRDVPASSAYDPSADLDDQSVSDAYKPIMNRHAPGCALPSNGHVAMGTMRGHLIRDELGK